MDVFDRPIADSNGVIVPRVGRSWNGKPEISDGNAVIVDRVKVDCF